MNELEIFNNPEFGQIRATEINGVDPEWEETYDTEIRQSPDPNRRRA